MKLRSTPGTVRVGPLRPKGPHEINLTHHILALMILLVTPCVQAEEVAMLPQLSAGERANWQAVGLLSKTGSQSGKGCTATLIAPDKVLTAAHCVANRAGYSGPAEELQFKAGQNGTKVAATRYGKRVAVHPIYGITKGVEKAAYDVAIVWLNRPIGADVAAPLPLSTQLDAGPPLAVLGYQQRNRDVLNGRFDCDVTISRSFVYQLGCHVISGNSGGPVLQRAEDGWQLVGVVSAKTGVAGPGRAIVVPIGQWVLHQLDTPRTN